MESGYVPQQIDNRPGMCRFVSKSMALSSPVAYCFHAPVVLSFTISAEYRVGKIEQSYLCSARSCVVYDQRARILAPS